jgi:hypothetical protein
MIDIISAIEVAAAAAGRQDIGTTLSDIKLLYGAYAQIKTAGKLDIPAMEKAKTLGPAIKALARTSALIDSLQSDPQAGPHVAALLTSIS